jgi:hypothetical protein
MKINPPVSRPACRGNRELAMINGAAAGFSIRGAALHHVMRVQT